MWWLAGLSLLAGGKKPRLCGAQRHRIAVRITEASDELRQATYGAAIDQQLKGQGANIVNSVALKLFCPMNTLTQASVSAATITNFPSFTYFEQLRHYESGIPINTKVVLAYLFFPAEQIIRHFNSTRTTTALNYLCTHQYSIEIMSTDPVIIYINQFISDYEAGHLLNTYSSKFESSMVYDENLRSHVDTQHRISESAMVPKKDNVSQCLVRRMSSLLENLQHIGFEPLQLVRYGPGGKFRLHYDWFPKPMNDSRHAPEDNGRSFYRLGSIFVYLSDDCVGGEAYFPEVRGVSEHGDGTKFARTDTGMGLLVKPKKGNAIFWNNMHMNGTGDERVLHAGLPIESGVKLGMNMFSKYFLDAPLAG